MCQKCVEFREALGVQEDIEFKAGVRRAIVDQIEEQSTFPKRVHYKQIQQTLRDVDEQIDFLNELDEMISHGNSTKEVVQMADVILDKLLGYALPCCKEAMNFFYYYTIPAKQRSNEQAKGMEGALRMNRMIELTAESLVSEHSNELIHSSLVAMTSQALTDHVADYAGSVIAVKLATRKALHPLADLPLIVGDALRNTNNHKKLKGWRKIKPEDITDETTKFNFLFNILSEIDTVPNDIVMYHQTFFTHTALQDKMIDNKELNLSDFLPVNNADKLYKLANDFNLDYDKARYWIHWVHLSAFFALRDVTSETNKEELAGELWTVARYCIEETPVGNSTDVIRIIEDALFGGAILPYDKDFQEYLTFNEFCKEKLKAV